LNRFTISWRIDRRLLAAAFVLSATTVSTAKAQVRTDTLQGRVVTDSGTAVQGATISITRAPDRAFLTATTDSLGRFKIEFADGTGDYLVHAAMVGYKSARQRVTRNANGAMPSITLKLASAVQKLATVKVEASKPKPDRTTGLEVGTTEAGRIADGVAGKISPDLAGNLEAAALTFPGVSQVAGGISVLGMGPEANSSTLNGMAFSGASLPRDARTSTRVSTSTYDPSRGGFSGAQTSVELEQGNIYSQRTAHVTVDDPALQYGGATGPGQNQRFRNLQLSMGGNGVVDDDKIPFNFGLQGAARAADLSSLESASQTELRNAGISSATSSGLFRALSARSLPLDRSRVSANSQNFSAIGRIDRAPYDWKTFNPSKTSWGLVGFASLDNQNNSGLSRSWAVSALFPS
jgi:hypothetical protein